MDVYNNDQTVTMGSEELYIKYKFKYLTSVHARMRQEVLQSRQLARDVL